MRDKRVRLEATVLKEFAFLKAADSLEGVFGRGLALPSSGGMLLPVAWANAIEGEDSDVLGDPHRCAFRVCDRRGSLTGRIEVGMRGEELEVLGIAGGGLELAEGLRELVRWCEESLWPERVVAGRMLLDGAFGHDATGLPVVGEAGSGEGMVLLSRSAGEKPGDRTILTAGPSISMREAVYALDATKYGWNEQWAKYLRQFERSFAEYVGVRHAIATSSCTGALHLALLALGVGPGDEVIVPDITWVATGNAVLYAGAMPVFADVDLETWTLDPADCRAKVTPRTKAIMPVHLYGHPCRMDAIMAIAEEKGLSVVEDAAPSIGAEVNGRRTGSFGDFAAFSFQGAKLAVTGEGGMLLTDDEELYKKAYVIWDQGRRPGTFWIERLGWKYKMANALAAIGLGQLERNDEMVDAKRRVFRWYNDGLRGVPHVSLNHEAGWARSIYWMTSLLLDEAAGLSRDDLIGELKRRNVDTRPVFPAISQYPIWPVRQEPGPNAFRIGSQALNLPSGVRLLEGEVRYICDQIRDLVGA